MTSASGESKKKSSSDVVELSIPELNPLSLPSLKPKVINNFEQRVIREGYLDTRWDKSEIQRLHCILCVINRLWRDHHLIPEFTEERLTRHDHWELTEASLGFDDLKAGTLAVDSLIIHRGFRTLYRNSHSAGYCPWISPAKRRHFAEFAQ